MEQSIILMVESGADVSPELAEEYGIYVVPMHVAFDNEDKDDGSFPTSEIIDYFERTGKVPKTAGSTIQDFEVAFDKIHAEHPDSSILYLAYSAVTTCSYSSAIVASKDRPYVRCIDTKVVSAGQCAVAVRMAEELRKHPEWDLDAASRKAEEILEKTRFFFLPTNLKFLQAGGRLSNAAAVFGKILQIIPFVELKGGYLIAQKKYRGKLDTILQKAMTEYTAKNNFARDRIWFVITEKLKPETCKVAEECAKRLGFKEAKFIAAGGVITTHGGPNAIGVAAQLPID